MDMDDEHKSADKPNQPKAGEKSEPKDSKPSFFTRTGVILLGTVILALIFFWGIGYLIDTFTHESTDDAFLDGIIVSVAPKVSGQVQTVSVHNNQAVKQGDLLVALDPRDLAVLRDQKAAAHESAQSNEELAKASLALLRAQISAAEATARQSKSEVIAVQAGTEKAKADLKRAEDLLAKKTISPQEFDAAKAAGAAAEANTQAANEKAASDASKVTQARAQLEAGVKAYERAEAQSRQADLDTRAADLNLSYARITAPEDGLVTRKSVEEGDYIQAGQKLMALVTQRLWITANFKETQLREIRTNQTVEITIDSVDGRTFSGRVQSIQAGSGARFSLLPPENAVGNYIKVVQRVPVRIYFDALPQVDNVLGPGMSVNVSVRVKAFTLSRILLAVISVVLALILAGLWWRLARRRTP
jgi:membrane fusion protein (multidrug efflux system)